MGTGYTRNDTGNNIADGNVINASDLDGEFDAIVTAFNSSTGHTHDGTSAEGAPVTVVGPVQDFVVSATEIKPKTTNTLDIGTSALQFKNLYIDGTGYIDAVDIDGGNIDGTTIGASSAAAITGTTITGTSFVTSGDMTFGDSDKAIFGAGSDLQIYHDGSHARLRETTGEFRIQTTSSGVNAIVAKQNAEVELTHAGSTKLATTSTGIDVTGTLVSDGLTVDSSSASSITRSAAGTALNIISTAATATSYGPILGLYRNNGAGVATHNAGAIQFRNNDSTSAETSYAQIDALISDPTNGSEDGILIFRNVNSGTMSERLRIDSSGNVGIGSVSGPSGSLSITKQTTALSGTGHPYGLYLYPTSSGATHVEAITSGASNTDLKLRSYNNGTYNQLIGSSSGGTVTTFETGGSERMRIDSSGNVGIGTTAAKEKLDSRGAAVFSGDNSTGTNAFGTSAGLLLSTASDNSAARITAVSNGANDRNLELRTLASGSASTALTLDSSQNATFSGDVDIQSSTGGKLILTTTDTTGTSGDDVGSIDFYSSDTSTGSTGVQARILGEMDSNGDSTALQFFTGLSTGSGSPTLRKRIQIDGATASNGNISFFDDSGTSAKFYWDAHNERLGIGTSSPGELLTLSDATPVLRFVDSDTSREAQIVSVDGNLRFDADNSNAQASTNIAFRTDGSERMRIDSSGNVGIGTSSPATQFENLTASGTLQTRTKVNGSTASDIAELAIATGTRTYLIQSKGSSGDFVIRDSTGAADRITMDTSGQLGIGTSSPNTTLNVNGTSSFGTTNWPTTTVGKSGGRSLVGDEGFAILWNEASPVAGNFGSLYIGAKSGNGATTIGYAALRGGIENATDFSSFFAVSTQNSGGTLGERIRITSSGNVGIGTTSPSSYNVSANNLVVYENGNGGITIASNTTSSGSIYFADGTAGSEPYRGVVQYNHASDYMRFLTSGSERLRIDSSGAIGIGTSSPARDLHLYNSSGVADALIQGNSADSILYFGDSTQAIFHDYSEDELVLWTGSNALAIDCGTKAATFTPTATGGYVANTDTTWNGITIRQTLSHASSAAGLKFETTSTTQNGVAAIVAERVATNKANLNFLTSTDNGSTYTEALILDGSGIAIFNETIRANSNSGAPIEIQNGSATTLGRITFDTTGTGHVKMRGDSGKGLKLGANGSDVVTIDTSGNTTLTGNLTVNGTISGGTFPDFLSTAYTFDGLYITGNGSSKITTWGYGAIADESNDSNNYGWHDGGGSDFPAYWAVYMDGESYAVNRLTLSIHANSIGNFKLQGSNNANTSGTFYNTGTWTDLTFTSTGSSFTSQNGGGTSSGYPETTEFTYRYDNDTAYTHYRVQVDDTSQPGSSGGTSGYASYYIKLDRI